MGSGRGTGRGKSSPGRHDYAGPLGSELSSLSLGGSSTTHERTAETKTKREDASKKAVEDAKFRQGKARQELITRYLKESGQVNLLFLFDATGSMGSYITFVKDQFRSMFEAVKKEFGQVQIKAGVVAYRDFDCGDNHTEVLDFTGNPTKLSEFLGSVAAKGGGDACEDIFTGLEKAATLSWDKGGTRLIMHVADAPCHGKQFHDLASDDHAGGDPKGRKIKHLLANLFHDCRVTRYFFSHLNNHTVKMISEFRKAAPEAGWIQDDHVSNNDALAEFITSSIVSSVSASMSAGSGCEPGSSKRPVAKNYPIKPDMPAWHSVMTYSGKNSLHDPPTLAQLHQALSHDKPMDMGKQFRMDIKKAPFPFSDEGCCRYPFYAIWVNAPAGGSGKNLKREERLVVLKEFKRDFICTPWIDRVDLRSVDAYKLQGEIQAIASLLAREFSRDAKDLAHVKDIRFPQVYVVSLNEGGSSASPKFYNMEVYLQNADKSKKLEFIRFTNNNGAVSSKAREHPHGDTVLAFSHYSYEKTNKNMMVTDLQGCWCTAPGKSEPQFTLSDPMIHSDKFLLRAPGNFGKRGIEAFFKTHKCNDICRALKLQHPSSYIKSKTSSSSSTSSRSDATAISSILSFGAASSASSYGSYM